MATLLSVAIQRILDPIADCECGMLQDYYDSCSCEFEDDKHDDDCDLMGYEDYSDTCDACLMKSDLMERLDKFFYDPTNRHFRSDIMVQLAYMDIPNLVVVQIVNVLNQVEEARRGKKSQEKNI